MENKYNLENIEFKPICTLFKFGKKYRLEELRKDGHMYLKRLKYFVDLEKKTLQKGQGDKFEARLFQASSLKLIDPETNNIVLEAGSTDVADTNTLKKPVFCIAALNILDKITSFKYPKFESEITFDNRMIEDFSDKNKPYVLVISNVNQFISRVKNKLENLKLKYEYSLVEYRDTRYIYEDKGLISLNTAFHKDTYFEYQNEFRILLDTEVDDFFEFDIGSIEDISKLIPAKLVASGIRIRGSIGKPMPLGD